MKTNRSNFLYTVILATIVLMSLSFSTISSAQKTKPENKGFVKLFNGENWDGW